MDDVYALAEASPGRFFEIPAPLCLFEFSDGGQVQWYLAGESERYDGVIWRCFVKDGDGTHRASVLALIKKNGDTNYGRIGPNGEVHMILEDEVVEPGEDRILKSIMGMACAVEVFSCSNVTTVSHSPPKFINSKRLAKGKIPFFTYKTLHITSSPVSAAKGGDGTHASPRLHMRRGHIRRIAGGRSVWVRSAMVGDKSLGFADKEYAVK